MVPRCLRVGYPESNGNSLSPSLRHYATEPSSWSNRRTANETVTQTKVSILFDKLALNANRLRQHTQASHQISLIGVFLKRVADPVDRGHKKHAHRHQASDIGRIMQRA